MMTDDPTATPAASIPKDAQQQLVTELVTRAHAEGGSLVGPDGLLTEVTRRVPVPSRPSGRRWLRCRLRRATIGMQRRLPATAHHRAGESAVVKQESLDRLACDLGDEIEVLATCSTVRSANSPVAASNRSGTDGARCCPRSTSNCCTAIARSSIADVKYSTGIADSGGRCRLARRSPADRAEYPTSNLVTSAASAAVTIAVTLRGSRLVVQSLMRVGAWWARWLRTRWGQSVQAAVGPVGVVVDPPVGDEDAGFEQGVELPAVEQLVAWPNRPSTRSPTSASSVSWSSRPDDRLRRCSSSEHDHEHDRPCCDDHYTAREGPHRRAAAHSVGRRSVR